MITDPWFYVVAIPAVVLSGLGKGGLSGLGNLSVPLMALIISPVQAAAIMLPILIIGDWIGMWAYRREWDATNVKIILPAAIVGVGIGWASASYVSEPQIRFVVGLIGAVFTLNYWLAWRPVGPAPGPDWIKGSFWGFVMGFTSFFSHGGGPPFAVYLLPQRLPSTIYAGTSIVCFAIVNHIKIPAYALLGQFSFENIATAAVLLPLAWGAAMTGVWVVRHLETAWFYTFAYASLFVISLKLVWDGAWGVFG
jgi:uncharacterized membrane protein YfcA